MILRELQSIIEQRLYTGKAIVLMGARQVGKTTLLRTIFQNKPDVLWLNGDELDVQALFSNISATRLKAVFGGHKTIVLDEAQRIKDVGLRMKLVTDQIPEVQLVLTGSSSFELASRINEPLTGRKWEYTLFPVSFSEMVQHHGLLEEKRLLPHRLVYGYYPEVVSCAKEEDEVLKQLTNSYLYKDLLSLEQIKKTDGLLKLLKGLAYQVSAQVSLSELSRLCELDVKTVEKYISVLEQAFLIFRLGSFSRNLRSELKRSQKIYFFDNGIRNALISNFNQIENRPDSGALWENFILSERMKYLHYKRKWANSWYWRTTEQQEVDYIEEQNGEITAFEFKWNPHTKVRQPKVFLQAYPGSRFACIHPDNLEDFLL